MELKPQTTFDEQVELLKEKGILINDSQKCTSLLKRVNYYRFSAYYLPFRNTETQTLFCSIDFDRIQKIYEFDQELRSLIFKTIEKIEIHLRTQLSYYHAHTYGQKDIVLQRTIIPDMII